MDRFLFFSRKQKDSESLEQFWNVLNGLAAICEFEGQTTSLVYDIFILNMNNPVVQEKLCTEPKSSYVDALQFAIAFERGVNQKRTIAKKETQIKEEPIQWVDKKNSCYRCGAMDFNTAHLKSVQGAKRKMQSMQENWSFCQML